MRAASVTEWLSWRGGLRRVDRSAAVANGGDGPAAPAALPGTVVLLATFNGEAFLAEQLRSLRDQRDEDWVLVVRDDLSTDRTPFILEAFAANCRPGQVVRLPEGPARLGALGNFLALLAQAPPGRRYAFCDQDDVWLPDKLLRASRALAGEAVDRPALYCARQRLVDGKLEEQGLSPPIPRPASLRNAFVQNIATGCTVVLNEAARQAILATPPPAITLHDWWAYLVTTAVGGHVIVDPHPVILYRQHGANVVGAAAGGMSRALRAARRGPAIFTQRFLAHVEGLLRHPHLTPGARHLLQELSGLPRAGFFGKLSILRRCGLYRQGVLNRAGLYAWVACWHLVGPAEPGRAG